MDTEPNHAVTVEAAETAGKRTGPCLTRRQFLQRALLAAGATTGLEIARETNVLEVTVHRLPMPGLKAPCRLLQLSDLHRSWCVSEGFLARAIERANAQQPDVVALTGDFVTRHAAYIGSCARQIRRLKAAHGLYAVLGNHDYSVDNWKGGPVVSEGLRHAGVHLLINKSVRLENGLRLVGVDDYRTGRPDPVAAFRNVRTGEPVLAMTHNPFLFETLCRYDCVTLAGHTHGGQINLPYITQRCLGGRMRYQSGWYREPEGPGRLYVSRGLGVIDIPVRIGALPEISVFDLIPA